jgi:hypothetical protein
MIAQSLTQVPFCCWQHPLLAWLTLSPHQWHAAENVTKNPSGVHTEWAHMCFIEIPSWLLVSSWFPKQQNLKWHHPPESGLLATWRKMAATGSKPFDILQNKRYIRERSSTCEEATLSVYKCVLWKYCNCDNLIHIKPHWLLWTFNNTLGPHQFFWMQPNWLHIKFDYNSHRTFSSWEAHHVLFPVSQDENPLIHLVISQQSMAAWMLLFKKLVLILCKQLVLDFLHTEQSGIMAHHISLKLFRKLAKLFLGLPFFCTANAPHFNIPNRPGSYNTRW